MPQPANPPRPKQVIQQLKEDLAKLAKDAGDLWDLGRQPAEDVVTVVTLADYAQRGARRVYLWAAAPVVRLEQRLAALESTAARVDARLTGSPGPSQALDTARRFSVRTRPTTDRRFQVDVEGDVPDDAQLVFMQNGSDRRGRVTQSGAGFLRGDIALAELRPGQMVVVLEHDGRREPLTTVDVGGS